MKSLLSREARKVLSPGEQEIIALMKIERCYSSAGIYRLLDRKKLAQSSVSVLLDRLYQKGVVSRETETARGGIRFLYTLERNQEKFEQGLVDSTVRLFVKRFGNKAIAYFNESLNRVEEKK